ncbi:eukaryotic mitochondrial regulator protein-domain-containing protein [Lasiosphaeris hirsuta]|uniref:Eukaryotic mitochondrial regulator protein-domain-containing protein n=1 Tax=Lasiosphaeris hirsuta TaxID=260670 RepID=A0AA40E2P4_9PEZI|nr:eukaryotic mitochondrial regulator protein-domain-containing protein [Lasiosphaeris hirsuta]
MNRKQRDFYRWLKNVGSKVRDPPASGNRPSYLGSVKSSSDSAALKPFPANDKFVSQPVLSEEARERIWKSVMVTGLPLKAVSAQYGVDMRRVAAVIRLKAIENEWEASHKPMALPYAKAVLSMVPVADLRQSDQPFEAINDIPVHKYTQQQLFVPTSESRHFTRADAAKAFGEHILPPDEKMRIPELIQFERDIAEGVKPQEAQDNFVTAAARSEDELAAKESARVERDEARKLRIESGRFEFRFEKINVDSSGKDGRSRRGVGWRYGVPFNDRRRAVVKIPTKVE